MFETEVNLGFDIEKVEFPAKSFAGVTTIVALVEVMIKAGGTGISIVVVFPEGRLVIDTEGNTSKLI